MTEPAPPESGRAWHPLLFYCVYRVLLAVLLALLVVWGVAPRELAYHHPALFQALAAGYLGFAAGALVVALRRRVELKLQSLAQVVVDIVVITLVMHASGGLTSGFGLLLVIAVAAASILLEAAWATLCAALAAVAVLLQQVYVYVMEPAGTPQYTHAGLLGLAFFATMLLISASARRLRQSEARAARQELDLAQLANLNQHIIRHMQSGVLALDRGGRVQLMNESAQRMLGLARWQPGERLLDVAPELGEEHARWLAEPERRPGILGPSPGGLRVMASFAAIGAGAERGTVVFLEDAAAMNQRAQQLKLASLGRLAGSIAHEIRNPLSAISHAGQLLEESDHLDSADRRLTQIIAENSQRMNTMVENVMELGRGRNAVTEPMPLEPWLQGFLGEFCASRPGAEGHIDCSVEPPDLEVRVDRSQLHQIVWNLCDNALQHSGDPPEVRLRAGIGANTGRPYLEVEDNGAGIDAEELDRVFEPFFTTRDEGTGLGLYIARELCEGNQATLTLARSDGGCCFRITFQDPRRRPLDLS